MSGCFFLKHGVQLRFQRSRSQGQQLVASLHVRPVLHEKSPKFVTCVVCRTYNWQRNVEVKRSKVKVTELSVVYKANSLKLLKCWQVVTADMTYTYLWTSWNTTPWQAVVVKGPKAKVKRLQCMHERNHEMAQKAVFCHVGHRTPYILYFFVIFKLLVEDIKT